MGTTQRMVLGSLGAIAAISVLLAFAFAFVLAPLLVGGGFALVFLLYQLVRKNANRS